MVQKIKRGSNERVIEVYRTMGNLEIPLRVLYDDRLSPAQKVVFALVAYLCWQRAHETGEVWTDFSNRELNSILGGLSARSVHRHLKKLRELGYIKVEVFMNEAEVTSYRKIYLTSSGIKFFFDVDMHDSITANPNGMFI